MTFTKQHPATVNSIFNELFQQVPSSWTKDFSAPVVHPKVNIQETPQAFLLDLLAPGLNREDFKIQVDNDLLTLSFEKKAVEENKEIKTIRKEFKSSSFKRSFHLDDQINTDGIQAKYENGILKITLPKKEQVKQTTREISID